MSNSRIQLALNVENVAEATAFYERLFGAPAHKQRDGYANFAIEDPPLKLVLIENPGSGGAAQPPRRRGARTRGTVTEALERFQARGLDGHRRRAGHVLPRRAGQGVRRRPRRSAGLVGVLQRSPTTIPLTRTEQSTSVCATKLRGPGHRVEPWGRGGVVLGHRPPDPATRWAIATIPAEGWTPSTTAAPSSTPRSATGSPARRSPTCLLTHSNDWRNLATCRRAPRRPRRGSPSGATAGRGGMR